MTILPIILFSIAALASTLTIWISLCAAAPAFHMLRAEREDAFRDRVIHVRTVVRPMCEIEKRHVPAVTVNISQSRQITHRRCNFSHHQAHAA